MVAPGHSRRSLNRARQRARQWHWPAIALFVLVAIIAGVLIVVGDAGSSELSFEIAKAGIQLLAVAILGGAVAQAFRSLDTHREELRRVDADRAATIDKLWDAYLKSKAVRRRLRAAGFGTGKPTHTVTAKQSADFQTQMELLNDAQLELELLKEDVDNNDLIFGDDWKYIADQIRVAEKYLRKVIHDWEENGAKVQDGADSAAVTASLENMNNFLGKSASDTGGIESLSDPIHKAVRRIRSLRFGADTASAVSR
jgi:hypothetical protein